MFRNVYAPSDYTSKDKAPGVSAKEKLARIGAAAEMATWKGAGHFSVTLPYVTGAELFLPIGDDDTSLFVYNFDVGDRELYGRGIGTRLLRAGVRFGWEQDPAIDRIVADATRLGFLNTVIKVCGEDNVTVVTNSDKRCGQNGDYPLADLFNIQPPVAEQPYLVYELEALIDPAKVACWPLPEVVAP